MGFRVSPFLRGTAAAASLVLAMVLPRVLGSAAERSPFPSVFRFVSRACRGDVNKPSEVVKPRYGACQSRNLLVQLVVTKDAAAVIGSSGSAPRAKVQAESCIFPLHLTTFESGLGAFVGVTDSTAFKGVSTTSSDVFVLIVSASHGPPTGASDVAPGLLKKTLEELNDGLFNYLADGTDRPVDCRAIKS
jgi:hypothetical protein